MQNDIVERIEANPNYQRLVHERSTFGWILAWLMLIVYYGFILLVAFNRELLSTPIGSGVTTWGMPIGLFVILFTVVVTGIYVRRANNTYDALTAAIKQEVAP
ncbi:MAG: DUF485 domain-containing protein [Massilia sp.]